MQGLALTTISEPADSMELLTAYEPVQGPGEALVEMEAATINASDFLYVRHRSILPHPGTRNQEPGTTIGSEGVARVVAIGPATDPSLMGQRVALLPTYRHGTWATHVTALEAHLITVPDNGNALQVAMLGINPMTALRLLRDYGNPDAPQRWIGQTAENSAVGEYLIKLARHFGHQTLNVVRREQAAKEVSSWGAGRVVIDGPNLGTAIADALAGDTLDIAVDSIGGPSSTVSGHHLRYGGTLVTYAFISGQPSELSLLDLIGNHASRTGFWLHNWWKHAALAQVREEYQQLIALIFDGTLSARDNRTFALDDLREAIDFAQNHSRDGKLLFTFNSD